MAHWYETIEGSELQQGDFFSDFPVIVPPASWTVPGDKESPEAPPATVRVVMRSYDVVVMSQSCDLLQRKLDLALVCPHYPLSALENADDEKVRDFFRSRRGKEETRRGYVPAYHMLAECDIDGFRQGIHLVDFRTVFSVPFEFLTEMAQRRSKRLRLLSPYREHLSQAFARFFMRVGLPADIPPFQ